MRWILVVALLACQSTLAPKTYREWYAEIESCSGLQGNFNAINWKIADNLGGYYGYWTPPHTIQLVPDAVGNEHKVKHEEMHDLLQSGLHPAAYFQGKCGNLLP
jgi:hypothetical protein